MFEIDLPITEVSKGHYYAIQYFLTFQNTIKYSIELINVKSQEIQNDLYLKLICQ